MATQQQKQNMRPKIRKIVADFANDSVGAIAGSDNLGTPPPVGLDVHSVKGMKERLNNEAIIPEGGTGRVTYAELEGLHKNKKKVKDLEALVFSKV